MPDLPDPLLALLSLVLLTPLLWQVARRHRRRLSARRHRLVLALRLATLLCASLALSAPTWNGGRRPLAILFAVDVSESISPVFLEQTFAWIDDLLELASDERVEPGRVGFLGFAGRPALRDSLEALRHLPVTRDAADEAAPATAIDRGETDLEAALELARAWFPAASTKRLVLITDGRETSGEAWRQLPALVQAGVRIFPVPAPTVWSSGTWIETLEGVPQQARSGEPVQVEVVLGSAAEARRRLQLVEGGRALAERELELLAGRTRVPLGFSLSTPGLALCDVVLADAEGRETQRRRLAIRVEPPPRVLYVSGNPAESRQLRTALEEAGFEVSRQGSLPADEAGLDPFDAVLIENLSPLGLEPPQLDRLASWVEAGGGLVFVGGPATYGLDGYGGTKLEEILPVRFEIPDDRRELALVILLDKSYSMEGAKMEVAKAASKGVVDILEEHHQFGLVAFDWNPYTVVPLQPASRAATIKESISRIQASAQTNFYPALQRSLDMLEGLSREEAPVRHVILVSDGKSYPDAYEELLGRMTDAGITVSTVAVGEEADRRLLADIARWGGGRTYALASADRVEQILIDEARITSQETLTEEPFQAEQVKDDPMLAGLDFASAPPLLGHVTTKLEPTAELLLRTPADAPLLARWHWGLGTVVAFTSDAEGRWAARWLGWPGFRKLWAQTLRHVAQRPPPRVELELGRRGREARIGLRVVDERGAYVDRLQPEILWRSPQGPEQRVRLAQEAPGTYALRLPLEPHPTEPYLAELVSEGVPAASRALLYTERDEERPGGVRFDLLQGLSEASGGDLEPDPALLFAADPTARSSVELWPLFTLLALLLFLAELFVRRAPWDLGESASHSRPV